MGLNVAQQEFMEGLNLKETPQDVPSLNPEQQALIDSIDKENADGLTSMDAQVSTRPKAEKAQVRAGFQGLTLGFADEIEAFARSVVEKAPYEEIRDEIRAKLNAYQEEHPGEAISYELLGAIAPTALAYISPIPGDEAGITAYLAGRSADVAQKGASFAQKAMPIMKRGAAEGAVAGYATGQEGVVEDLGRIPLGATMGAAMAGGTTAVMNVGGAVIDKVLQKTRQLFGDKASTAVGDELQRLVDSTGFSAEEILRKIENGEIIAENATLEATMRALKAEMPKGGKIDTVLPQRAKDTKEVARAEMQEGMTPGVEGNVFKAYTISDNALKKQESSMYGDVFTDSQELTPEIVDTLADSLKRFPNAKDVLGEIYQAKGGLVPFYKIADNGEIQIVRMPTLEDAEIVRRGLNEATTDAYKSGKGGLGEPLSELEDTLRKQLDAFSPALKATRKQASNVRGARDAYKLGRGSLSKNVDELEVEMEQLIGVNPTASNSAKLKAFRAGAMNALRDKIRKMPTYLGRVSDEGSHENTLLRTIFPEEKIDDLLEKARIAGQSQTAKQRVLGGSPTAMQKKADELLGTGTLAARAAAGDPTAQLALASDLIKQMRPEMTAIQKDALVDLLLSEDANFVRKALMNESAMAKLQQHINNLSGALTRGATRATTFKGGEFGGDLSTGLINMMSGQQE